MKIYFAPLEGITGYIFRNIHEEFYGHIDKYFAPFISPAENCPLTPRAQKDLLPENNNGIYTVPQILCCNSGYFIEAAKELEAIGYKEINLNLGCPSGTVCSKGRGAGFLTKPAMLRDFLEDIYSYSVPAGVKISIKTRLGFKDPEEFPGLLEIFNLFPVSELIVHPRIRTDFYKGVTRKEFFAYAMEHSRNPLVYNGNIFSQDDYDELSGCFGRALEPIMLGRGLISDPALAAKLKGDDEAFNIAKFRAFHDRIYHEYQKIMTPDINVIYKMRELWTYWKDMFEGSDRDIKQLFKAKKYADYESTVLKITDPHKD